MRLKEEENVPLIWIIGSTNASPLSYRALKVGIIPISFNNFGSICEKNAVPTYLPTYQIFSTYLLNPHEKSYEKTKKNPPS